MREMISTPELLVYYDAIQQATEEFRQAVIQIKKETESTQQMSLLRIQSLPRVNQQTAAMDLAAEIMDSSPQDRSLLQQ